MTLSQKPVPYYYHFQPTGQTNRRHPRTAVECRNRPPLHQTDRPPTAHPDADPSHPVWDQTIDTATYDKLPNRSRKRNYPRAVWYKGQPFPVKHLP
jgi:hypothetical protein